VRVDHAERSCHRPNLPLGMLSSAPHARNGSTMPARSIHYELFRGCRARERASDLDACFRGRGVGAAMPDRHTYVSARSTVSSAASDMTSGTMQAPGAIASDGGTEKSPSMREHAGEHSKS
jgi:hypothetical protein